MKYVLGTKSGMETCNATFAITKILLVLFLLLAGVPWSQAAVAIYSPRGAEVFGGTQTLISPPRKQVQVEWYFPWNRQTPDLIFKVYHSTNLGKPLRQWNLLTNVSGVMRSLKLPADKPQEFFFVTASNYLGEVDILPPGPKKVRLQWDYPTQARTRDLVFKVYHSTNLTQGIGNWALLTNVPGRFQSIELPADKPHEYFAVSASNYLGESAMASR